MFWIKINILKKKLVWQIEYSTSNTIFWYLVLYNILTTINVLKLAKQKIHHLGEKILKWARSQHVEDKNKLIWRKTRKISS